MKSTLTSVDSVPVFIYPKLMYCASDKELVVLFSATLTGTVVHKRDTDCRHKIGEYRADWNDLGFRDFIGEVQLENTPVKN